MKLEKDNTIEIKEVSNGFIVKQIYCESVNDNGVELFAENVKVIEDGDRTALKRLLEQIAEWMGHDYDKFGSENINITFDKVGHKCE